VLGLGNPGETYRATRHNVGFRVVEEVARRHGVRLSALECNCLVGELPADPPTGPEDGPGGSPVRPPTLLALPQTYMNRSGHAARCLVERRGFAPAGVLVVYDEVSLPLGKLRLRRGGSPGGHRGIESIVEGLRTAEVPRLRCGVAGEGGPPAGEELADYVLGPFAPAEEEAVAAMVQRAADAVEAWLVQDIAAVMNAFNR
jgi:peptidyl-tRNA hydrolase, PTH1 family